MSPWQSLDLGTLSAVRLVGSRMAWRQQRPPIPSESGWRCPQRAGRQSTDAVSVQWSTATVHTVGSCFLSRCMHSALLLRGKDAPCYVVPVLRRAGTELPCSRLTVRHRGTAGSSVSAQVVVHHASSNCWRRFRASDDAWCNFFGKVMQCEARFCVGLPQVPTRHQRTESLIPITHSTRASVVPA